MMNSDKQVKSAKKGSIMRRKELDYLLAKRSERKKGSREA